MASLLGIDNAAAAPRAALRANSKRSKRLKAALARKKRLKQVQRAVGSRAKKVFVAGIRPAATYGAQIWGLDDGEAARLRKLAAAALRPQARGRSLRLTMIWHGLPTAGAENAPLLQYARMIWSAAVRRRDADDRESSIADIRRMWEEANKYVAPLVESLRAKMEQLDGEDLPIAFTRKLWRQVRGPLGAAALTAARIGWTFTGPFTVRDQSGAEILFTNSTPAMINKRATEALKDSIEKSIARRWAVDEPQYQGRRASLDLVVSAVANSKKLTPFQKGIMRSATCGAVMTGAKAIKMGYRVDGLCALCRQALDTLAHRVYECPCTMDAVSAEVPGWFLDEARRSAATCRFWTTGACPDPGDLAPLPPVGLDVKVKRLRQSPSEDASDLIAIAGRAYIDGSSTTPAFKSLARAACAIVQTTAEGEPTKVLQAAVPRHLPQTAQAAEFLGLGVVMRALRAKTEVVGDCLNVVRAANGRGRDPFAHTKVYAGILLDTHADPDRRRLAGEVKWTRAHRKLTGSEGEEERRDIVGNAAADLEAKDALDEHPEIGVLAKTQAEFFEKRITHVVRAVTTALAMYPRASGRMVRDVRPVNAQQARERRRHLWEYRAGAWRCRLCNDWLTGSKLPRARVGQQCRGTTMEDNAKAMARRGHNLCKAIAQVPFVYCTRCGAWGHRRSHKLALPCAPPVASGMQALARIRKQQHPMQERGPGGVLLRRERVRTVACYVAEDGIWRNLDERRSGDERASKEESGTAPSAVSQEMMCDVEIERPPEIDRHQCTEDEEDVFGHGGSLSEDDRAANVEQREMPSGGDQVTNTTAGHDGNSAEGQGMRNVTGARSSRRHVVSILARSDNSTVTAALQRIMAGSRPPANNGAERLREVRRRVMQRIGGNGDAADSDSGAAMARPTLTMEARGASSSEWQRDETVDAGERNVRQRTVRSSSSGQRGTEECLSEVTGAGRGVQGAMDDKCATDGSAQASSVAQYASTACEGPGDPSLSCSTEVATWLTAAADVTTTVAGGDVAAVLVARRTARDTQSTRGEAASGPPHGAAAPWEGTMGTSGKRQGRDDGTTSQEMPHAVSGGRPLAWRELDSPHKTPQQRLGAGPSSSGSGNVTEQWEPTPGVVRRRDGGADPAADSPAARGSGDAAELGRREETPSEGVGHRTQGARKRECPSPDVVHSVVRKRPREGGKRRSTEHTVMQQGNGQQESANEEAWVDNEPTPGGHSRREAAAGASAEGHIVKARQRNSRSEEVASTRSGSAARMVDRASAAPLNAGAAGTHGDADHHHTLETRGGDRAAERRAKSKCDGDSSQAWTRAPGSQRTAAAGSRHGALAAPYCRGTASGGDRRESAATGGTEEGRGVRGEQAIVRAVIKSKEDEEGACDASLRRRGRRRRRQRSGSGSPRQPRLRHPRGSSASREREDPKDDHLADSGSGIDERCSPGGDPRVGDGRAGTCDVNSNSLESLNAHALRPAPPDGADGDGVLRNGRQTEDQEGAAAELMTDFMRGRAEAAHLGQTSATEEASANGAQRHARQQKRRRIRGKQPVSLGDADASTPRAEGEDHASRTARRNSWDGEAAGILAAQGNSVRPPVSAGASRSSCGADGLDDVQEDRNGQALQGAHCAAGTVLGRGANRGVRGQAAAGSWGGPPRRSSYLFTVQCPLVEEGRGGPLPAMSSSASVPTWAPCGGRPPDAAGRAA